MPWNVKRQQAEHDVSRDEGFTRRTDHRYPLDDLDLSEQIDY